VCADPADATTTSSETNRPTIDLPAWLLDSR